MGEPRQDRERINQKRRTRAAVLAAAVDLLREGRTPTVAEAAERAAVSRATAYRYFPSQDLLVVEAGLQLTVPRIERALAAAVQGTVPEERIDALVTAIHGEVVTNEASFRALLHLSLEPRRDEDHEGAGAEPVPARAGRRVRWAEEALAPIRGRMAADALQRLVAALTLTMGVEPFVVLRDVCALAPDEALAVARWAARALVRQALAEAQAEA